MHDFMKAMTLVEEVVGLPKYPFHCEHDTLTLCVDPRKFSGEQIKKMDDWGFWVDEETGDWFNSYRWGSC
jgi:hypothetical protein